MRGGIGGGLIPPLTADQIESNSLSIIFSWPDQERKTENLKIIDFLKKWHPEYVRLKILTGTASGVEIVDFMKNLRPEYVRLKIFIGTPSGV